MSLRKYRSRTIAVLRLTPICAGVLLAGCGGSGGMSGPSAAPTQSTHAGSATATFSGTPHPEVIASNGPVSTFSQAGASFSSFIVNPTPNLDATSLLFTRDMPGQGFQVFTAPANGSTPPVELMHNIVSGYSSISKGGVIAFLTQVSGQFQIQTMLPDGSYPHVVLNNVSAVPSISPNGQTIVYLNIADSNLYSIPASGGTPKQIYSGGNAAANGVSWSPNGQQIAFTALVGGYDIVYTMAATGGTATNVLPSAFSAQGNAVVDSWSPDGNTLACTWTPNSSTTSDLFLISLNDNTAAILTPTGLSDSMPSVSPDNRKLAFYRTSAGGATPGIYESDFDGGNPQLVITDPPSNGITGPVVSINWSFFQPAVSYIGAGGLLTTSNVSGFLMSEKGDQFASLLTMTATTPSTAKIVQTGTTTPGSPQLYMLSADAITNISFTNVYIGGHTSFPLTSTTTATVSVDSTTGYVDFVAPGKFQKQSAGSRSEITGQFTAIYDKTGKNLAPSGATTIQVDSTTGKLISFR